MVVCGHRGAAGLAPENTLTAFRKGLEVGVDALECDVHLSADGRVMIHHDPTLDRTTNGKGALSALPASRLRELDAGDGGPVPYLEELLELAKGRADLVIEFKDDAAVLPAYDLVRGAGMLEHTTFISFELHRLVELRKHSAEARVSSLWWNPTEADIAYAATMSSGVDMYHMRLSPFLARVIKGAGLFLRVYTPNDWHSHDLMIRMGVDAITTDRPDILLEGLGKNG